MTRFLTKTRYLILIPILGLAVVALAVAISYTSECTSPPGVTAGTETMKAVVSRCYGGPDALEYLDIEKAATLQHKNWLKKYFRANFSMNREWEWYKRIFDDQLLFRTSGEKFTDLQKNMLLRQNIKDGDGMRFLEPYRKAFEASGHSDPSLWYSYIDLKLFQAEHFLAKLDRVSMAHSIESRTPFLDHNLAESVFSIAPQLRYQDGVTKALLKKVAADYLPAEVIKRKKKGFSNPYMEWLAASGKIGLIEEVNEQTGLFNRDVLKEYIERGVRGRFKQHVWGLYVLSYWIKRNLL